MGQTFTTVYVAQKTVFGAFLGNLERVFLRKIHFCIHPFQPKTNIFGPPEWLLLAKHLENKVLSVHTMQSFTIWSPNVAPKKLTVLVPRTSPKTIWSIILTYFFTQNVPYNYWTYWGRRLLHVKINIFGWCFLCKVFGKASKIYIECMNLFQINLFMISSYLVWPGDNKPIKKIQKRP